MFEQFIIGGPDRIWTIGDIADFLKRKGGRPTVVGASTSVVDQLEC